MTLPNTNQHYRLSLGKAIQDYKDGIITATGLVYYTVGIYRAPGQKLRVKHIEAFCAELSIGVSTFYKAISKLKLKGRLNWEAIAGLDLWIPESNVVEIQSGIEVSPNVESNSLNVESDSPNIESDSPNIETNSPNVEFNQPKSLSSNSSSFSSDIYQIFINSLSDGERESFLNFGLEKAQKLPKAPELPEAWVKRHWEEIRGEWEKNLRKQGKTSQAENRRWEDDPRTQEWVNQIIESGFLAFIYESGDQNPERQEFFDWARCSGVLDKAEVT
ncbi:hypothetical protein [Nostoc sp. NZL]|uniref:hypothetical protein n=1 Tax=Nostoc sp. NZL TaxID=2650612 RepID=UPI0018C57C82|nr:hypothetical protein [Nostoc sp. NZL]